MAKEFTLTPSNEDYLEAILHLEKNGSTRSVDVAKELKVTKPAVSVAANDLIAKGLITKEAYGDIILTEAGRKIAVSISAKHVLIKKFLLLLGATEENAEIECCKSEHIFSDHTMECIASFCADNNYVAPKLEEAPKVVKKTPVIVKTPTPKVEKEVKEVKEVKETKEVKEPKEKKDKKDKKKNKKK